MKPLDPKRQRYDTYQWVRVTVGNDKCEGIMIEYNEMSPYPYRVRLTGPRKIVADFHQLEIERMN